MTNKLLERYVEEHEKIARAEGELIGELNGINKERNRWITAMIEDNVPYEKISRYTGLYVDEIKKVINCRQLI